MSEIERENSPELRHIIEALLLAAGGPLSLSQLVSLFEAEEGYSAADVNTAIEALRPELENRGIELKEVASGFRLQTRKELQPWVSRLWEQRPQRYSRAMLETLSLIAYRQPVTRGEIEEVRGVSVSSSIIRTLQEREWIRVVGHRDVPGKPALFGTTKIFLDYFELVSLDDLPTLAEIKDMESLEPELDFEASANEPASESDSDPESDQDTVSEVASDITSEEETTDTESPQNQQQGT
jgi:segregation and condensation protein B